MSRIQTFFRHIPMFFSVFLVCIFFAQPAHAGLEDIFNMSVFVPLVLQSMMNIATSMYKYFVGNGDGLIYVFIYAFLAFYLVLFLVKMYLPKDWLSFLGFSGGGEMWDGSATGWSITENVAKPCMRVLVAGILLLQIKPIYVTDWLVNPFLEFGSVYTENIFKALGNSTTNTASNENIPSCPESIIQQGWLSERSCDFLVKPVHIISRENNRVIEYGLTFLVRGFAGPAIVPLPLLSYVFDLITGFLLVSAFFSSNVFMTLLIIQAIFDFCLALIMYPFNVLAWVAKKSDKWFDILPPFSQIINSLKEVVITMIACSFILCINVALVRALFSGPLSVLTENSQIFFGQHSMVWLSSILTFFLMQTIFKITRERLEMYTKDTPQTLYKNVTSDAKNIWGKAKNAPGKIKNAWQMGKALKNKIS